QRANCRYRTKESSTEDQGHATREADTRQSAKRAKEEFPEAPDPAIGMQDERGGKGH
ncbi:hypothetical protein BDY21DRAFT_277324, partial [Lineolata rhizophorae]